MKTHYWILGMVLAVSGCATHAKTFYDRPNTTLAQTSQDSADCELYSMNMQGRLTDVVQTANAPQSGPVGVIADHIDRRNREARAATLCMQAKGYRLLVKK